MSNCDSFAPLLSRVAEGEAAPLWTEPGYQATASFSRDGAWLAWGSYHL